MATLAGQLNRELARGGGRFGRGSGVGHHLIGVAGGDGLRLRLGGGRRYTQGIGCQAHETVSAGGPSGGGGGGRTGRGGVQQARRGGGIGCRRVGLAGRLRGLGGGRRRGGGVRDPVRHPGLGRRAGPAGSAGLGRHRCGDGGRGSREGGSGRCLKRRGGRGRRGDGRFRCRHRRSNRSISCERGSVEVWDLRHEGCCGSGGGRLVGGHRGRGGGHRGGRGRGRPEGLGGDRDRLLALSGPGGLAGGGRPTVARGGVGHPVDGHRDVLEGDVEGRLGLVHGDLGGDDAGE